MSYPKLKYVAALFLGALLPFAFAPWGWFWIALIIPGLYEALLRQTHRPALTGFLFGMGFFGVGASWVFVSIHEYSDTPLPLALIITAGFVAILAGMLSASAALYIRLKPSSYSKQLLIFPALWALTEAFRGWFLTGFPWLFLGDTIVDTPLKGFLPIVGVFGVSWVIVILSQLIFKVLSTPLKHSWPKLVSALGIGALSYGLSFIQWTQPNEHVYSVTLLQGNIPQLQKWDPAQADANFSVYYQLTKTSLDSDIIIWPEASLPVPMPYAAPYMEVLTKLSAHKNNAFLIGELYSAGEKGFLNSAQAVGLGRHRYDKTHLVPFGEYLPFNETLGPLLDNMRLPIPTTVPGTANQIPLTLKQWQTAIMICYEIAFPMLTLSSAQDSDVLITISNDTWFGNSIGPKQHFQISRTRALETGRYVLRATNNGITGFIAPDGKILAQAPQFVTTSLTRTIPGMSGRTPIMFYTHWAVLLVAVMVMGFGATRKS